MTRSYSGMSDSEFKLLREALEICDDFMVIEVAKRWVTVD